MPKREPSPAFTAFARAFVLLASVAMTACTSGPPPPDTRSYEQQVLDWRTSKDAAFRSLDEDSPSPLPREQRATFPGLVYFPVDPDYHVPAALTREASQPPIYIELQTSGPELRRKAEKVGWLGFTIKGTQYKLTAFADEGSLDRLFVPFGDLTNNPRRMAVADTWSSIGRPQACTTSTSIARSIRSVSTTPRTTARFLRAKIGCRSRSRRARNSGRNISR